MKKHLCLLLLFLLCLAGNALKGQTGPSEASQDSLHIFAGSGQNQLLISGFDSMNPDELNISVVSRNTELLDVLEISYVPGQTFAIVLVLEKGIKGIVQLEIGYNDGVLTLNKIFDIHIVDYDNKGMRFEIHDIVFWQESIPSNSQAVFDTIIHTGQGPYTYLNYRNIPLTVNLDCQNSPPCTGNDFYTAFYKGYIVPPVSGTYYFAMESPDRFGLWISNDENFSGMQNIIYRGSNRPHVGESLAGNRVRSFARELVGGKTYAFYATQWIIHSTFGGILWEGPDLSLRFIEKDHIAYLFDKVKPSPPEKLKLEWKASDQALVSWGKSTDNDRVAGYNVYVDGIRLNNEIITGNDYRIFNLENNTLYDIVVTALDRNRNESLISNTLSFKTYPEDVLPPLPPDQLELVNATGLALHIKWSGATDAETEVIAYNVYVNGVLYNPKDFIFSDEVIIYNLGPESAYGITVEALDAGFNVSQKSQEFIFSTSYFDPLGPNLGEKSGRIVIHNRNISWNQGFGLNVPYENGSYPNQAIIREIVEEFGAGAVRWGAITANSRSFSGSTGISPSHNNTYARVMNHANQMGAFFALTVGVNNNMDYMTNPETFLRLMEYLNGPSTTPGGARRASEGFADPLLPESPGVILEFGNEVWGGNAHQSPIGVNYDNYGAWVREMIDLIRTSPYFDPEKIILTYSGRYPHPANSFGLNNRVLTGDKRHADCLAVSGYLGGNLNYDPIIPQGESELDYYRNAIAMARNNMTGFEMTIGEMFSAANDIKKFYLYESNMTTPSYNGRFGQAIVMTDYLAAGMRYGSIVPTIFHLTGGEWRITRPSEGYKRLPLFETGKLFNQYCKGHILETEFITNNYITNSSGNRIDWEPVGAYAYNRGDDFSILLVNRDFSESFTVQLQLPAGITFSPEAKIYTLWSDDFSSFESNLDSMNITLTDGMLVTVPKHSMLVIAAKGSDPQFKQLEHGYFDRIRVDSLRTYTDAGYEISTSGATINLYGVAYPENAFSRAVRFEILENSADALLTLFSGSSRLRIRSTGICGNNGIVKIRAFAVDNHTLADTITITITNQGTNCNVSTLDLDGLQEPLFTPNPATSRLFLNSALPASTMVDIFDVSGRRIMYHRLEEGYEKSLDGVQPGLLLIRVITPDGDVLQGKLQKN